MQEQELLPVGFMNWVLAPSPAPAPAPAQRIKFALCLPMFLCHYVSKNATKANILRSTMHYLVLELDSWKWFLMYTRPLLLFSYNYVHLLGALHPSNVNHLKVYCWKVNREILSLG